MNEPFDELYFSWLYSQLGSVKLKTPSKTYWSLLKQLFTKEFVWFIPNDDNRVEDGRDLRYEFLDHVDLSYPDQEWMYLGCSMLEMILGLSRRLAFEAEGEPRVWFWEFMDNLKLEQYSDARYDDIVDEDVNAKLDTVIWRTYDRNGNGGLFPLRHAAKDQRKIELWYQKSAYILERY